MYSFTSPLPQGNLAIQTNDPNNFLLHARYQQIISAKHLIDKETDISESFSQILFLCYFPYTYIHIHETLLNRQIFTRILSNFMLSWDHRKLLKS